MPAKRGKREQGIIRLFVSAYEQFAWAGSKIEWLDEAIDGAIDALITRSDSRKMAIEHTLIQPFVGERSDQMVFEREIRQRIQEDKSLAVPDVGIYVYVPVGILKGQKPAKRDLIVKSIHSWLSENRLYLRDGEFEYQCDVPSMPPVTLTIKRNRLGTSRPHPGSILVGRQQVTNNLDEVIEEAFRRKLPKLVNTEADRHVLFLERDQFSFLPELIFAEIERQRPNFHWLEKVDEIWHVETVFYEQGGHVDFERWKGGKVMETMAFENGSLTGRSMNGMPYPM